jgi:glycosyltransferase involved in cell wall biosynthesis
MARLRIIGINYAPESTGNAPYTTGLAEHLAASGHEVTVVTGLPHYPAWRIAPGYGGRLTREEERAGVRVRRRAHYVPASQSAVRRAIYEGTFLVSALQAANERGVDAVIGVVPSLSGGILARLSAIRNHVPYGLLFQDLMGPAAAQSGVPGGGRVAGLTRTAEGWAVANATAVAVVSDGFRPYLEDLGVLTDRIHLVPNWTHIEPPRADRAVTRRDLGWDDGRQVVLHAGNMGAKQGLEQVVEAARLADERGDPVRFVLLGDGNQRTALEDLGAGITCLEFAHAVDDERFPDVLAAADVLLLSERATVVDMSLPSKLTSYAVAGRPIVAAVPGGGTTAAELGRSGAALRVEPGDPIALLEALAALRDDPDLVVRLGEAGSAYVTRYLRRDVALARADAFVAALLERA